MTARHRHRRRGQRDTLPAGVRLVTRASRWGNPYVWDTAAVRWCRPLHRTTVLVESRSAAVAAYRADLADRPDLADWLAPLADAVGLACDCPLDAECHADVLLDLLDQHHPLAATVAR